LVMSCRWPNAGNTYKGPTPRQASMERALVRQLFKPSLREPFLVSGLPGVGNVGENVASYLSQMLDAKLFAELISPRLPDYVIVEEGICRLPRYAFYAVEQVEPNLVILTGDAQPPQDDVEAYYEVCEEIVGFAKQLGVKAVVSVGGFAASSSPGQVFVASSSEELGKRFLEAGARPMPPGRIVGPVGLLPAMAAEAGIDGACLLGAVSSPVNDRDTSLRVLKVLMGALGLGIRPLS